MGEFDTPVVTRIDNSAGTVAVADTGLAADIEVAGIAAVVIAVVDTAPVVVAGIVEVADTAPAVAAGIVEVVDTVSAGIVIVVGYISPTNPACSPHCLNKAA